MDIELRFTDLPEATTVAPDDVFPFDSDPAGSPSTKKVKFTNLKKAIFSEGNFVSGTSQAMAVNAQYIPGNAALCTLTLPAAAAVGQRIEVVGYGAGGWRIAQNSGQTVHGSSNTTTGAGGFVQSATRYDSVTLVCVVANTDFVIVSQRGTPNFT